MVKGSTVTFTTVALPHPRPAAGAVISNLSRVKPIVSPRNISCGLRVSKRFFQLMQFIFSYAYYIFSLRVNAYKLLGIEVVRFFAGFVRVGETALHPI